MKITVEHDIMKAITLEQLKQVCTQHDMYLKPMSAVEGFFSNLPLAAEAQAEKKDWIAYKAGDAIKDGRYLVTLTCEMINPKNEYIEVADVVDGRFEDFTGYIDAYMPLPEAYNKNGV